MAITIVLSRNLVLVATNTATSAGGPDTCTRIRGDTQARQPYGLAAVSATGAVPRSRWRRRGGSPIADPRRARVRSGPRVGRRSASSHGAFAPRTMLTGIAFVVAPSSQGTHSVLASEWFDRTIQVPPRSAHT